MTRRAFTLIETMLAVLLMALLASGVALSFSKPLAQARAQDALDLVASFDADARRAAIASGASVRIEFDLADGTLTRTERGETRAMQRMPGGFRIDETRVDGRSTSVGRVPVDVGAHGWSRSYAVRIVGPDVDRWLHFAGLTGDRSEVRDEHSLPTPRDDAD